MRRDDVLRALPPGVALHSAAPADRAADLVEAVAKDGRVVVGLVPLDDGSVAVLSRATSTDGLIRGLTTDGSDLTAITEERDRLRRRLDKILHSRSYRLARRMARAKRAVAGLIHWS